jgi:tetratricopeptide (TPR) repeat protein
MRTKAWRNRLLELLPLVLVCAAVSGVTLLTQSRTGATGSLAAFPVPLRLTNAADACLHYLTATFVPTGLAFFYPHPGMLGLTVPASRWVTGVLVLVAVTVTAVWLRRARPYALVGWAWFLLTLVPVVGLVQVGFLARADRYTYLPSIGLLIAVVWACADVAARLRPAGPACATAAALVAAACLAVVTHVQLGYWRDGRALAERAEAVVPDNYLAREALALDALEHGRPADGLPLARSAAALSPHIAEVHDTLGQLYEATGQLRPAFDELAMAVRIAPRNPYVRDHLGHLLVRQRRDEDAATQFRRALALDPGLPDAHQSLGAILASRGSNPEAIAEYRAALALDPHFAAAHASLADALRAGGDLPAAADEYRAAVTDGCHDPAVEAAFVWLASLDPGCPLADLAGMAELADDACARTRPPQPFPFYARSLLLARLGRFDDAVASGERALALSRSSGQAALTAAIERRLAAYRQGRPDPLPDPAGLPTTTTGPTRAGTPEPTTMP